MEQGSQVAGAHIHLLGNQGHRELVPNVLGDVLLGPADDLVFRVDSRPGAQLLPAGGGHLPQEQQKQHIQLGQDHVRGQLVPLLPLPEHALQQPRHRLGGGKLPAQQRLHRPGVDPEGDGDKPGGHPDVRVLHVPLPRAVEHQVALLQNQLLAVGHGVEAAPVHIGQLRHGMGLPGKQEALLLLLIEEGVDALHQHLALHAGVEGGLLPQTIRGHLGIHIGLRGPQKGPQPEADALPDAHGLVQIVFLPGSAVHAYPQHAAAGSGGQPGIGPGPAGNGGLNGELPDLGQAAVKGLLVRIPLGRHPPEAPKGELIQIADHAKPLPKKNTGNKRNVSCIIRQKRENGKPYFAPQAEE